MIKSHNELFHYMRNSTEVSWYVYYTIWNRLELLVRMILITKDEMKYQVSRGPSGKI